MKLKKNDLEMILDTISKLQADQIDFRNSVLKTLRDIYGYRHLTFFLCDEKGFFYNPTVINMNKRLMNEYEEHFFKTDIFHIINSKQKLINNNVLSVNTLMSFKQFENTEFYNDLLKKYDLYHELAVPLKINNRLLGCIGILRSKEEGAFTNRDICILEVLNKHISSNLNLHMDTLQLRFEKQIIQDSTNKLPVGVLILDKNFSTLFINETGKNYCQALASSINNNFSLTDIVKIIRSQLPFQTRFDSSFLQTTIGVYDFKIVPFIAPNLIDDITTYYTIYITHSISSNNSQLDIFSNKHNLTEREKEIVKFILEGYSNTEIGASLHISANTAKTHIFNIFKKTKVNRRINLIKKIKPFAD